MRLLILKSSSHGGLGDQLIALNRALGLARLSNRTICIDWRDTPYCRNDCNLFDVLFDLRDIAYHPVGLGFGAVDSISADVVPSSWSGNLGLSFSQISSMLGQTNWDREWASQNLDASTDEILGPASIAVIWNHCGFSVNSDNGKSWIRRYVVVKEGIQRDIDKFVEHTYDQKMIGLHVRRSNEQNLGAKTAAPGHYVEIVKTLRRSHPRVGVYLASDNASVYSFMENAIGNIIVFPKWMPEPGVPLHFSGNQDECGLTIAVEALIEMTLLAHCDWIVRPRDSCYSIAASLFSDTTKCNVIVVQSQRALGSPIHACRSMLSKLLRQPKTLLT
jgi:hypothetical protein